MAIRITHPPGGLPAATDGEGTTYTTLSARVPPDSDVVVVALESPHLRPFVPERLNDGTPVVVVVPQLTRR